MKNKTLLINILLLLFTIFACKKESPEDSQSKADVSTGEVTDLTGWSAIIGGEVKVQSDLIIISKGICWKQGSSPTINDFKTNAGEGQGTFQSLIKGLTYSTTYYARAYATTKSGTTYGPEISFTTLSKTARTGFRVCGTKVYDPQGKEFVVKGVNVGGPGWSWNETTTAQFEFIVNKWKFNTIRLCVKGGPDPDSYISFLCAESKFPEYQYTTFGTLREIIKKYTDAKTVVLISWHKVGGLYTNFDCAASWWKTIAREYKDNPYVWFDMFNEPQVSSNETWKNTFQEMTDQIRSTGNTNIIVATGNWWGQDANDWNCANVSESKSALLSQRLNDPADNIVYAFHAYDQWTQCQGKMDDFLDRLIAKGKCVIVGEYGVFNNNDVSSVVEITLSAVAPRKIGRIAWAWWGGDKNDLTTGGNGGGQNTQYDENGNATNLTAFGSKVWTDLRIVETLSEIPADCK